MTRPTRSARSSLLVVAAVSAAMLLAACHGDSGTSASSPSSSTSTIPVPTVTSPAASPFLTPVATPSQQSGKVKPPPTPKPPKTRGKISATCIDGWKTPPKNQQAQPLKILTSETGWKGTFVVTDMRAFDGPESPPDPDTGYLRLVQRWYVKGYVRQDPALQGRFLVEKREFGSGLSAVAPYDTKGWSSPNWVGFQYEGTSAAKAYPNLPGTWAGTPYDFVKGGEGLDIPGLPSQVVGCLAGT